MYLAFNPPAVEQVHVPSAARVKVNDLPLNSAALPPLNVHVEVPAAEIAPKVQYVDIAVVMPLKPAAVAFVF